MISPEKAEIIGLLCAEGSYSTYYSNYLCYYPNRKKYYLKKNKKTVYIQFGNYDKKLLDHFKELVKKVYNYDINVYWDRTRICKRDIINDLVSYTDYGRLKWKVPKQIIKGNKSVKIKFLRGYFDGDGTVSSRVRMFSINKNSLMEVSKLLNSINIKNTFKGPYYKENRQPSYYIHIMKCDENRFLKLINPISKIKQ